jgi:formate hydrogenlyase transcriptional activator
MATESSWIAERPALKQFPPLEIEDLEPAKLMLNDNAFPDTRLPRIIGKSGALQRVLGMVRVVAPTGATVLINGETGTGKELIAEAIHACSDRPNGPFVKVNCAAIPAGLLESELFGHERGAFTGAVSRNIGRFERANHGTLFLDEIGDLPLELQPKLLRVMQERRFERVGGASTIHADVRVICATHRNLIEMVNAGQFRADLFYRLSVFPIELPPLRERPEDIRLLTHHFALDYAARMRKRITTISEDFMAIVVQHSWPGNVRELQNFIERSVIISTGPVLTASMPERVYIANHSSKVSTPETLEDVERSHILKVLEQTKGVVGGRNGAAARLGIRRTTLICKMQKLGINLKRSSASSVRAGGSGESMPSLAVDPSPRGGISDKIANSGNAKSVTAVRRMCTLDEAEREHITEIVGMTNGLIAGRSGAAEVLGVPPSTLRNRMKKLGIEYSTTM